MDANQLQSYREAAAAAKARADKAIDESYNGVEIKLSWDVQKLATAVAELVAEVERLQEVVTDLQCKHDWR